MKGHQIRALHDAGFPIDVLIPAGTTVPAPTRGAHDDWARAREHAGCSCPDSAQGHVPFHGTTLEPHTYYTACSGTSGVALEQLKVVDDLAVHYAGAFRQLEGDYEKVARLHHPSTDVNELAAAGAALFMAATRQSELADVVRGELAGAPFDPAALQAVQDYFDHRAALIGDLREQFAQWWWPAVAQCPERTRLTYFNVDEYGTDDVLAHAAAGEQVAHGHRWSVARTPPMHEQALWTTVDEICDLGPAGQDLPAGMWATFGELIRSVPAREAFDALIAATRE